MSNKEHKILVISDMHVGSVWGLWPPGYKAHDIRTDEWIEFVPNGTQMKLWKHWQRLLSTIKDEGKPDIVIFNGDLIDGRQKRDHGRGLVTPNLMWQAEACMKVIDTLPKVPFYFTQGTDYHEIEDMPAEQYIAARYGAEFGDDLLIDECGIRIHAQHFIPVSQSSWQYRSTPVARDELLLAVNNAQEKYGEVDLAIRSHAHYFVSVSFRSQFGLISPCWQTRTPYAVKKGILSPPDIGWVMVHVRDRKQMMVDRRGMTHIVKPSRVVGSGKK